MKLHCSLNKHIYKDIYKKFVLTVNFFDGSFSKYLSDKREEIESIIYKLKNSDDLLKN